MLHFSIKIKLQRGKSLAKLKPRSLWKASCLFIYVANAGGNTEAKALILDTNLNGVQNNFIRITLFPPLSPCGWGSELVKD